MTFVDDLQKILPESCQIESSFGEVNVITPADQLLFVMKSCKEHKDLQFDILIDLCGVDYLHYGLSEWKTTSTTSSGYSRATSNEPLSSKWPLPRIAVVYHLLSTTLNQRLRVKVFASPQVPEVPTICDIYSHANWYEREAFDLFGIVFINHPDLRRILTDYGFKGFPFRKDFPVSGFKEIRYDHDQERCVYEDVNIEPRVTVPKVIRDDNRYVGDQDHE